ncbi:hypothetical protein BJY01DRAFT_255313 [Aspergillus pseudoustus]|uniref:Uncharacterized protein n=1 Tax=Aspergillus pseudoustus TaxID=1810923 RepID=A0ABR4ILE2_9EURO
MSPTGSPWLHPSFGATSINFVHVDPAQEIPPPRTLGRAPHLGRNRALGMWGFGVRQEARLRRRGGSLMKREMMFPMADFFPRGLRLQSGAVDPSVALPALTDLEYCRLAGEA